ncbi:6102_t:CDS:2 [Ambispora gerdemannii]|uniref:6102_t:CDS:1 n=1 Tax=Ambispora gerdemannii TaxID=144530 RepID=A0A9N9BR23_9GLOM|nr:6102_t:CDS:2 [Ambispora gerdemannii]
MYSPFRNIFFKTSIPKSTLIFPRRQLLCYTARITKTNSEYEFKIDDGGNYNSETFSPFENEIWQLNAVTLGEKQEFKPVTVRAHFKRDSRQYRYGMIELKKKAEKFYDHTNVSDDRYSNFVLGKITHVGVQCFPDEDNPRDNEDNEKLSARQQIQVFKQILR